GSSCRTRRPVTRLSDGGGKCDLGSPVRENCTPGSARGDEYKEPCRLGETTASKGAAPVRLRKGYRSKARPYQPCRVRGSRHAGCPDGRSGPRGERDRGAVRAERSVRMSGLALDPERAAA